MTPDQVDQFFATLAGSNPEPKTELNYTNPYTLLVAVALSAQATDVGVNKATKDLFAIVDTPQKMVDLGEDRLKDYIKTIGLFNTKAKNVIKLSQMLVDNFDGIVPEDRAALESLPGVGRKTANVVLNTAFGHETMAVDTHIFRLGNRTKMAEGKTPREVEDKLLQVIPKKWRRDAHHWLILHGRYVCVARKPKCAECKVYDYCGFEEKTA
ncbi:MAG: endonuclease III [Alphaproteobacteria bacterium]